jgi:hypothetical protein
MPQIMPEIAIQRLVQHGITYLRSNRVAFDDVFDYLINDEFISTNYGQSYVDKIWTWFNTYEIPVVQAWALNVEKVPCFSIHLSTESEDESKAAMSDFLRIDEDGNSIGINVFIVRADIGIHANKNADQVLWMYYILSYILFRNKSLARNMGLILQTFSASEWGKETARLPENIYTRWVRFQCTVANTWSFDDIGGPYDFGDSTVIYETMSDE